MDHFVLDNSIVMAWCFEDESDILFLAREHKLSTYDASYLDLAMREGVALLTLDKGLRRAATRCQIPLTL